MSWVGILFSANVSIKKMSWCRLRTLVVIHLLIETCYVYFFDIRASFWVTVIWNYHYWWRKNFKLCSVCTFIGPISNGNRRYRLFLWLLHVMWKTKQFKKRFLWHFTSRTIESSKSLWSSSYIFQKFNLLNCFTMHCAQAKIKKSSLKAILQNGMERMNEVNWTVSEKMCRPFLRLFCTFQAKLVFAIIRKSSS